MAEAFAIFSAVLSVLDVGTRVSARLGHLIQDWKDAPPLILCLANEMADLKIVLDRIYDAQQSVRNSTALQSVELVASLDSQLQSAQRHFMDLDTLVNEMNRLKSFKRRNKWIRKRSRASTLRTELKAVRIRISELLLAHNVSAVARVELQLLSVHADVQQNHATAMARMDASSRRVEDVNEKLEAIYRSTELHYHDLAAITVDSSLSQHTILNEGRQRGDEHMARLNYQHQNINKQTDATTSSLGRIQQQTGSTFEDTPLSATASLHTRQQSAMSTTSFVLCSQRSRCLGNCSCSCHSLGKAGTRLKLPRLLRAFVGSLFIGYTGYPVDSPRCNSTTCLNQELVSLEVVYTFPTWFLRCAILAVLETSATRSLTFRLTMRQRIPWHTGNILHYAHCGNTEMLRQLLQTHPACIDDVYHRNGRSAIQYALTKNNLDAVRLLLQAGANPDLEDDFGFSATNSALRKFLSRSAPTNILREITDVFPLFSHLDEFEFSFVHKVILGICPVDIASTLQSHDPWILGQVASKDALGLTPLHWAARRDDLGAVQELLCAGAQVNVCNSGNATPIISALMSAKAGCVDLLIDAGADLRLTDRDGWQPLQLACSRNHLAAVKKLLSTGIDVDSRSGPWNATGLSYAARANAVDVVQLLLDNEADIEALDDEKNTSLFYSIFGNAHECLRLLLGNKAVYTHVNKAGCTVLHNAAVGGDVETMNLLSEARLKGLDIHARDAKGKTASHVFEQRLMKSKDLGNAFSNLLCAIEVTYSEGNYSDEGEFFYDALE